MMNAQEATEIARNLKYGAYGTPEHEFYNSEQSRIVGEFRDFLADEYGSGLPTAMHSILWAKAWADGHSSGYHEVEYHYSDLVEFAENLLSASQK